MTVLGGLSILSLDEVKSSFATRSDAPAYDSRLIVD
jgi:hypothetical protein